MECDSRFWHCLGLVASGTLSNGATVIINTDGKVAGVGPTVPSQSFGSATVFESDTTDVI